MPPPMHTQVLGLPVERMRLGDHAFASYEDDEARWDILIAFAHHGLVRGEKVVMLADPDVPRDEVYERMHTHSPVTEAARARGQLEFSSMRELILPDTRFTAERQVGRLWEETDRACAQGYAGLRSVIDMAWVQDLGPAVEDVMHRETHADALFTDHRYAEICTYDRRRFTPEVVEAMRAGHPVALLESLGALEAAHTVNGLRLAGDADVATRTQMQTEVRTALAHSQTAPRFLLDLTHLCFLGVDSAALLLRLVAADRGCGRVEIRCRHTQAKVLRLLGADTLDRLLLCEVPA
ncbi:MEDS domain-containing protein [Streptomyces sp. BH034]|uniref:MEDS domain-containing protein n=2 Tax=unclassified Streptomyces TaxID=2593676 RepID=UPI003BB57EAA